MFRASDFRVSNGANLGDPLGEASDIILDDIYQLTPAARKWRLSVANVDGGSHLVICEGSQLGTIEAEVHLDCCATLMAPDGTIVEAIVLIETERETGVIAETYMLPLAEIAPRTDYALVDVSTETPRARFAGLACVSFTRGTHITMATGEQRRVEELRAGDRVLTRDNGIQPVRWVGQQTVRATGAFAPIVIKKGAMHNAHDLHLSPNQRLFVYQRQDRLKTGQAEVVVKAELLVNGDTVKRSDGGFVDYFQILFDNHEFIFAEGIATESLTVDRRTSPALPRHVQEKLGFSRLSPNRPRPVDLGEGMLDSAIAADILRKASML
ncbi:Glutamate synthase [NADPH] large chain [Candidatus Rhodobacter oscarellae]|uniref:Glutamate synthase [NADPH] large chain n=1 Tax=Candidatus Rhodobacter oscarellae TaxID=1675527 RepID=A0A0J9E6G6_9RHOB|nr:Glutamate synthase [NADPH] large chain [Candidatus Rhodobacter lobularis]